MFLSSPPTYAAWAGLEGGKRKCLWLLGASTGVDGGNPEPCFMEESSEPQLDAKSKVRPGLKGTGAAGSEARKTVP